MAPQWMPQNIQKRLLRYVLQQLSLFSEIDLPNLDVSLGANSKVVLRDLLLDPDKISIPGVFVRSGKVSNLSLTLVVGGGVSINASGADITVAISSSSGMTDSKNNTFSLAQSTMDLANSIVLDKYDDDVVDDDSTNGDDASPMSSEDAGPSRLNNMMTKAAELALSRLTAEVENINVRVITDTATMDIKIAKAMFSNVDGIRTIDFEGVETVLVNPKVHPGDKDSDAVGADSRNDEATAEGGYESEEEVDAMTSSIVMDADESPAAPSLMESTVFSHEEASSLYMSATSNFHNSAYEPKVQDTMAKLFHVNKGRLSFQGFQAIEKMCISLDKMRISATPWPPALTSIIQTLKRIKKLDEMKSKRTTKQPAFAGRADGITSPTGGAVSKRNIRIDLGASIEDSPPDEGLPDPMDENAAALFESFSVHEISIDLNAALDENGSFAKSDTVRFILKNVNLEQADSQAFNAFAETITCVKNGKICLQFDQSTGLDEADFVFTMNQYPDASSESKVSFPKPLKIGMDVNTIADICSFWVHLRPFLSYISEDGVSSPSSSMNRSTKAPSLLRSQIDMRRYGDKVPAKVAERKSKFFFDTEAITVLIEISDKLSLDTAISSIHFDNLRNSASISQMVTSARFDDLSPTKQILQVENIRYLQFDKDEIIRTFGIINNNQFDVSNLLMSAHISVYSMDVSVDFKDMKAANAALTEFKTSLSKRKAESICYPKPSKVKKKVRLANTAAFQRSLSHYITLNKLTLNISEINNSFGDLRFTFSDISVNIYKELQMNQAFIMNAAFLRRKDDQVKEHFFGLANVDDNKTPMIGIKMRDVSVINVLLKNVLVEYYTDWLRHFEPGISEPTPKMAVASAPKNEATRNKLEIRVCLLDCVVGLNPGSLKSKALIVLKKSNADLQILDQITSTMTLKTVSVLLIDDIANQLNDAETRNLKQWNNNLRNAGMLNAPSWSQVSYFLLKGFVSVANANVIHGTVNFRPENATNKKHETSSKQHKSVIDLKVDSDAWKIELCADSAQCLTQLLKDLKQPINVTFDDKYKPAISRTLNIFDDIEEAAFVSNEATSGVSGSSFAASDLVESYHKTGNSNGSDHLSTALDSSSSLNDAELANTITFAEDHFATKSTETLSDAKAQAVYPMTIFFSAAEVVLDLYDGFDWKETRKTITALVKKVQKRAAEAAQELETKRSGDSDSDRSSPAQSGRNSISINDSTIFDADESFLPGRMVEETAYDSIILSLPVASDVASFADHVNRDLGAGDNGSTTSSVSPNGNGTTGSPKASNAMIDLGKHSGKKLRLRRSRKQKLSVELTNLEFDMIVFTTYDPTRDPTKVQHMQGDHASETINTMGIKVRDFCIIDNVPTSTWNRFATYMTDAGSREVGVSMFEMTIDTVRPVSTLAATELVMGVHVLPLSLHVDQDALDFLARFGEFKDNRFMIDDPDEDLIFIQKFSVNAVKIKLDYKPKKIDYNGLRSGRTSEFMNFFILDEAEMILRKISLYGISGFPRLNKMLNDSWMPDIKSTQLSGVLAGLAPVRSLVNIGSGFRDLVAVPVREYKKDGRVVRSLQQGAFVFAKTTSNELLKFGVKIAAGTQTVLENTEGVLGGEGSSGRLSDHNKQAIGQFSDKEVIYAITDVKTLKKSKTKAKGSSSLIGRGAYLDSVEPVTRRGYHSQKALDSFEEVDSEDEIISAMSNLRSKSNTSVFLDSNDFGDDDSDSNEDSQDADDSRKLVSLYADQPNNMREGFQGAYVSLERNFGTARDALKDAGRSISEAGSAKAAAMAIAKATPVAVIRPIIGTTEAISKALLGGMNALDPTQRAKADEKYKSTR